MLVVLLVGLLVEIEENLDEASRAAAFRESIKRQHSLYEYMKEILNPNRTDEIIIAFPTPCPSHRPQMIPRKKISSAIPIPSSP